MCTRAHTHTFVDIWVCRQLTGIHPGCAPAAPVPPFPPSPSTPPGLPQTAPPPPLGRSWTGVGCSCRSPEGPGHRLVRCWRGSPGFGPTVQPHLQNHAAEPGAFWSGLGGREGSTAGDGWKTLKSTGSCHWRFEHAAWKKASSRLQQRGERARLHVIMSWHVQHILRARTKFTNRSDFFTILTFQHFFFCIFEQRGRRGTPRRKPT